MQTRFIIGVLVGVSSLTLAFEATGAESPGPVFSTISRDSGTSSSSREAIIRFRDGTSVRVGEKLAALIAEGSSAAQSKQYERAIFLFTEALQANPDKKVACATYFCRAFAYSEKGELDEALSDWTAAIQLNPKYAGVYVDRAIVYSKKRNYKLAIGDSTAAIQLNPNNANAYHNRGAYYYETGEFDKAIADLSEAIRFDPRSATTFDGRAQVYEDIEKIDKAMADYDRVIRITPKDADDYVVRGRAYFKKGNYKEALSAFEKALRLSPNNDSVLDRLARFRATCPDASLRNGKEAIRMSMRACELSKWKEPYRIETLAAAHPETGDFEQAVKYQTQAMKMKSEYGGVNKEMRGDLALYQAGKPARTEPLVAH
jgi:tetratricopeptide (TPR) repeat protein